MLRVVGQYERRRIGRIVFRQDFLLFTQRRNVTGDLGNTVIKTGFVGMPRIEYHDTFVRQYQKRRIVMVIRLEIRAYQHFRPPSLQKVILNGLHSPMHVNITDITAVYRTACILIMQRTRVGKPAPCAFVCQFVTFVNRSLGGRKKILCSRRPCKSGPNGHDHQK